jgi:5-methylcytosine-specific restriction endonuclease McrA
MQLGLDKKTILVLDKNYLPQTVISPRRAIGLLMNNEAKVMEKTFQTYSIDEWFKFSEKSDIKPYKIRLRSKHKKLIIPFVIYLQKSIARLGRPLRFSRKNIYARDDFTCQFCGKHLTSENITLDHILPKSRGGKSTWRNVVTSCIKCNQTKAACTLKELGWKLIKEPTKPSYFTYTAGDQDRYEYWKLFLRG